MSDLPHQPLSGYLLAWEDKPNVEPPDWCHLRDTTTVVHRAGKQWTLLEYQTTEKWAEDFVKEGDSYHYTFLLSRSSQSNHSILFGMSAHLVDQFMRAVGLNRLVFSPAVNVEAIVAEFTDAPNPTYVLSNVFAKVDGDGHSLRTIALWGADLADAGLFRQIRKEILPFRVEIRDLKLGHPVMSIGSRGELNFAYDGPPSLKSLLNAVGYLTSRKLIEWPSTARRHE